MYEAAQTFAETTAPDFGDFVKLRTVLRNESPNVDGRLLTKLNAVDAGNYGDGTDAGRLVAELSTDLLTALVLGPIQRMLSV